jgi:hypothetical protein
MTQSSVGRHKVGLSSKSVLAVVSIVSFAEAFCLSMSVRVPTLTSRGRRWPCRFDQARHRRSSCWTCCITFRIPRRFFANASVSSDPPEESA